MLSKITVFGDELRRMNSRFQSTTSELNACSTQKPNAFIARIGASKPEQSVPIVIIWSGRGDGNPCFAACSRQFFMATGAHELIAAVIDAGMRSFCPCGVARGFVLHGPTASSSDRLIEPVAEELRVCGIARWPCVARRLCFGMTLPKSAISGLKTLVSNDGGHGTLPRFVCRVCRVVAIIQCFC